MDATHTDFYYDDVCRNSNRFATPLVAEVVSNCKEACSMPEDKKLVSIDTTGLGQNEAKEAWLKWTDCNYFNVSHDFYNNQPFFGKAEIIKFGPGSLVWSCLTGRRIRRTLADMSRDKRNAFCILYVADGVLRILNKHGTKIIKRNSILLYDSASPFVIDFIGLTFTSISLNRPLVNSFVSDPEELFSQEIPEGSPWEKALVDLMRGLKPSSVAQLDYPHSAVAKCIISLLTLSTWPMTEPLRGSQRSLLDRLHRDMYDQLSDSSLNPVDFAAAHGISLRTLHAVFAESGTSFMKYLMGLRLRKAKSMLESKSFARTPIAEVAFLTGFVSPEHFSTRFRENYGTSPRSYRASCRNGVCASP